MTSPDIHVIIFLLQFTTIISAVSTSDLTTLIYKGCANQNFENPIASQNLKSLYATLVSQSSTTNFFKTTTGENDQNTPTIPTTTTTITGLFQCRGDLSNPDCNTCVKKLPNTIQKVCNSETIAARAQLVGCYMRYEVFGFQQVPATELLFKKCGSGEENGSGYNERLETALSMIPKGVSNGKGYYAGGYENVYVLGQCEGDLVGGECVNCLKTAVDVGRKECRSSVSGQVFLYRCYISYTYYPNGDPNAVVTGGDNGAVSGVETGATKIGGSGTGGNRKTERAVAIVFGGLAGVGLVVALLLVLKSACKKKKDHHTYTYSYGNGNNNNNKNGHGNSNGYNNGYGYGNGNGNGHGGY